MNSLILPLVVSLAALSAQGDDYRPAAQPVGPWVDTRAMATPLPEAFRVTTPGLEDALAGSAYPETLRFNEYTIDTRLESGEQSELVPEWLTSTGEPEDEFRVTSGGGQVIGFRWRFR